MRLDRENIMLHLGGIEKSSPRAAPWKNKGQKKVEGLGRGVQTSSNENFSRRMETSSLFLLFFSFLRVPSSFSPLAFSLRLPSAVSRALVRYLCHRDAASANPCRLRVARNKTRFLWDGNFICFRDACSRKRTSRTFELRSGTGSRSLPLPLSVSRRDKERDLPRIS